MKLKKEHVILIKKVSKNIKVKHISSNGENIIEKSSDSDVLITNADIIRTPNFQKLKKLKWLHVTSAGVNNLPEYITSSNIIVTNSSGVHPTPIAEQVFGYLLMFARSLSQTSKAQEGIQWLSQNEIPVFELSGKTVGIVGFGRIGEKIALIAKGFGMKVIALTRTSKKKNKNIDQLLSSKQLDKLLKESDIVINCLPATKETYQLFDLKKFKHMKPTAYFINIGRGTTVVEKDLIEALKNKTIAGAGLDVFEIEPLEKSSPLWKMDNVIITPHHAGSTPYYMDRVIEIFCENLSAYLSKKPMPNLVDKKLGY